MKYIFYGVVLMLLIFLLPSCEMGGGNPLDKINLEYKLVQSGELNIPLDTVTSFDAEGPEFFNGDMLFFNRPSKSLKVYDSEALTLKDNIPFFEEGPNGVHAPYNFAIINNEVALYEFYSQVFRMINSDGEVIDSLNTKVDDLALSGTLPSAISPFLSDENYLYITAQGSHKPNKHINHADHTIKRIDLKDRTIETFLNYPKNYENPITGGRSSIIATTYNTKTKSLIASFPLDHNIYELTESGEVLTHEIEPLVFKDFDDHYFSSFSALTNSVSQEVKEKFWRSYSYWAIHYDPYHDVYIRFINLPIPSTVDLNNTSILESEVRDYIAVVFNANFEPVAITDKMNNIELELSKAKFFSTEKGIHIFSNDQKDEDKMRFITFQLQKQ